MPRYKDTDFPADLSDKSSSTVIPRDRGSLENRLAFLEGKVEGFTEVVKMRLDRIDEMIEKLKEGK